MDIFGFGRVQPLGGSKYWKWQDWHQWCVELMRVTGERNDIRVWQKENKFLSWLKNPQMRVSGWEWTRRNCTVRKDHESWGWLTVRTPSMLFFFHPKTGNISSEGFLWVSSPFFFHLSPNPYHHHPTPHFLLYSQRLQAFYSCHVRYAGRKGV